MNRLRTSLFACALIGALALAPSGYAQGFSTPSGRQQVDARTDAAESASDKEALAESIVARQEAGGKMLDRSFRARAKADLASRSLDELLAIQKGGGLVPSPDVLGGNSAADLVYTPVAPCRVIDTRVVGGPIAGGGSRNFVAVGGFAGQGGAAGGCGAPFGPTTAIVVNIVAVNAAGAGDLRAYAFGGAVPTASIINFAKVNDLTSGLPFNVANAFTLKICDPAVNPGGCPTFDFVIQADTSATQVVMDILGFYRKVDSSMNQYAFTATGIVAGDNYYFPAGIYTPPQAQRCVVSSNVSIDLSAPFSTSFSYMRVALRNETAATNTNLAYGTYLAYNPTQIGNASSGVVALAAGTDYKFGCHVFAGGNLPNASSFVYCNVSVHCQ